MNYEVFGGTLPAALVHMKAGESIWCEKGGMSWMDDEIQMETKGGGVGKMLGRAFSGENMFRNRYTAMKDGEICFASSFPGDIRGFEITPGKGIIAQKHSFLCCDEGVEMSVFFQKKLGAGLFGGEGFIMEKFDGNGTVLIEIDGSVKEYYLEAGDCKIVDTGHLVMMDDTCSIEVQMVKGAKNVVFGGEGLFNTIVKGPGRIMLQTMPINRTAMVMYKYMPHDSK
ncbi:MAG: TIGR00266 family protein [Eubacterium sp.]|nr:TIGR00266 family protein [Eubacterium sp.]